MADDARVGPWRVTRTLHRGEWHDLVHAVADDTAPVAVKRLHRHAAREPAAAALFAAEAALVTSLPPHPNVVRGVAADAGTPDDPPWLAMAFVEGGDLRTRSPRSIEQAIAWILDACAGVAHLHAHGWLHGDLGPANLIADGDRITVCDLGCARALGSDGPVRGTHAYMAPEQVRGERWTPATDVFALGVVLWELVAGARLFFRGPVYLTMAAVIDAAPPPLADPVLDAIAQAALAKDPAARIATPAALADRLTSARSR